MATMEKPRHKQGKKKTKIKLPEPPQVEDLKEELQTTLSFSTQATSSQSVCVEASDDQQELNETDSEKVPFLKHDAVEVKAESVTVGDAKPDINDERCPLLTAESGQNSPILSKENVSPSEQEAPIHKADNDLLLGDNLACELETHKEKEQPKQMGCMMYNDLIIKAQALKALEEIEISKIAYVSDTLSTDVQLKKPTQLFKSKTDTAEEVLPEYVMKPFNEVHLSSLYTNKQLSICAEFVSEFVDSHLRPALKQTHPLQDLLVTYLRAINRLVVNAMDLDAMKKECREKQMQLWILETTTVSESGECQDGNPVSARHAYQTSRFNRQALSSLSRSLAGVRELVNTSNALDSYSCESTRLQIETLLQEVTMKCPEMSDISQNSPVVLNPKPHNPIMQSAVAELKTCIAILFSFQRRPLYDERFVRDARDWLCRLVALLLRVGTWQDHMFILNHVLRCPAGVGSWGAGFVQTPAVTFENEVTGIAALYTAELDHMLSTLATIILPIRERAAFLEQFRATMGDLNGTTDAWIVVDSEGEDDQSQEENSVALKENDLVALLNQVSIRDMFRQILCVVRRDDQDVWTGAAVSADYFLRVLSLGTVLIRILRRGFESLAAPRYRQLSKRLGRFVRHTVQYISDLWQIIKDLRIMEQDPPMAQRLQVEYDAFFVRATYCIHSSRHLGAWQFLAILPYNLISIDTLWKLWCSIHEEEQSEEMLYTQERLYDWQVRINHPELRTHLEDRLVSMPDSECYYLLTTYTNMALARSLEDWDFICFVALDLLQIGFLSPISQEACSKPVRTLLSGLVAKFPPLVSEILPALSDKFSKVGKVSMYLFRDLPLYLWHPTKADLDILTQWLRNTSVSSPESVLARYILSNLNWGMVRGLDGRNELFLSPAFHFDVALLVIKKATLLNPEYSSTTLIGGGVKQVSSMMGNQTPEHVFLQWAWDMFTRLHLHLLDQSESVVANAVMNLSEALQRVPSLEHAILEDVEQGVKQGHPLALLAAVAMTQIGHNVPLLRNQGFQFLHQLSFLGRYETVIIMFQHIVPLFVECVPSLLQCSTFLTTLTTLFQADFTYMKMAKNLIAPETPGPILHHFGNMICYHLEHYQRYGLSSPAPFVSLWSRVLTELPDWSRDTSATYCLDIVFRKAFFEATSLKVVRALLSQLIQSDSSAKPVSTLSSLISWVSTGSGTSNSLIARQSCPEGPWMAYIILELEQEEHEDKTKLWRELLRELSNASAKNSLDSCLKKAAGTVKIPAPAVGSLSIYKWSQQALDTPVAHPLQPLLWQKFFFLYLSRIPHEANATDPGSVGPKFFEGMINLSYLKRIKKKLQECKDHYSWAVEELSTGEAEHAQQRKFYGNLSRMFWTMNAWLEEPRLQEPALYLPALPPLYNAEKLSRIMQGDKTPWLEFLDLEAVQREQKLSCEVWESSCLRSLGSNRSQRNLSPSGEECKKPVERILKRLQSYDTPEPPPSLKPFKAAVPAARKDLLLKYQTTLDFLKDSFQSILEFSQLYALRISEHMAVDASFIEIVPSLYKDVETEVTLHVTCQSEAHSSSHHNAVTCAGPATIRIKVCEARVNERTERAIGENRSEYEGVLSRALQPPPLKVCISSVQIEHTVKTLAVEYSMLRQQSVREAYTAQHFRVVGVELFYHLVVHYNEDIALYPPSKQLLSACLETLGQVFISGEECECERLLTCMIKHPRLTGLLGPHFTPTIAASPTFVKMYQEVVDVATQPNSDLSFVLLSKFDVTQWLSQRKPKMRECSQFIDLVGKALISLGPEPADSKLTLHEMFRNHLCLILQYDFPEHYGSVLTLILRSSEGQQLSVDVWFHFLNTLLSVPNKPGSGPAARLKPNMNPTRLIELVRQYTAQQTLLKFSELKGTVTLLASHFNRERLQYGLYGLYPKYRLYVEALSVFLGMMSHAVVFSTVQNGCGLVSNKLCEQLWPTISAMYFPWIAPYWTDKMTEPAATWIQQLTDDRSVLPPWIVGDNVYAQRMVGMFVECVRFMLDTLPGNSNLLGFVWLFYVSHFAHTAIKEHTLMLIHTNLLTLPWMRFWPAASHLDLMLKVVDQYLPDCHTFLGSIFIEIPWTQWLVHVSSTEAPSVVVRVHICLLHLFVKLANEPTVRQSGKILTLLNEAKKMSWHLLDAQSFEPVVNWYVMSMDPRVVLRLEDQEGNTIDSAVLSLLHVAAGYTPSTEDFHSTTLRKRQMLIRALVKVLITCASRYKTLLESNAAEFTEAIHRMLDDINTVVTATTPPTMHLSEAGLLLIELLGLVNQPSGSALGLLALNSFVSWLRSIDPAKHTGGNFDHVGKSNLPVIVPGLLRILGSTVNDTTALGSILEESLEAYFVCSDKGWAGAIEGLQPAVPRQPPIEEVFSANGHVLSLHAILLLQLRSCRDIREEAILLGHLTTWLSNVKPTETVEPKLPLLWEQLLILAQRQLALTGDPVSAVTSLRSLLQHTANIAEHRGGGWSLLGAIGLGKQLSLSSRGRLLCRFLNAFVWAQLPESKVQPNLVRAAPNAPGSLTLGPNSKLDSDLDVHPNPEAAKALVTLETLLTNKQYAGMRSCIEEAVSYVRNPENSIHNLPDLLLVLSNQLYSNKYLRGAATLQSTTNCESMNDPPAPSQAQVHTSV